MSSEEDPGYRKSNSKIEVKTSPSYLPVMWKALPKYSGEVYFAGKQKKKYQRKFRSEPLDMVVNKDEELREEHGSWSQDKVKEIFPQLKNQCQLEEACDEEIKVLSLEDLKVHTKRVPKENPAEEELWNAADFPSVEIGAKADCGENKMKAEHASPITRSFSLHFKKPELRKGSSGCEAYSSGKVSTSNYCQTDHLLFAENYPDVNVKYLCTNLPPDLKKIFLNSLFERDELKRLLIHLLKLLCDSSGNLPQVSSVPLRTALSSSEKAYILSQIF